MVLKSSKSKPTVNPLLPANQVAPAQNTGSGVIVQPQRQRDFKPSNTAKPSISYSAPSQVFAPNAPSISRGKSVFSRTVYETKHIDVRIVIYDDNRLSPLVGMDSKESDLTFSPWRWNDTMWASENYANADLRLPVILPKSLVGIPKEYWQDGVADPDKDLEILRFKQIADGDEISRWTAELRAGTYYLADKEKYLFPDRSEIQMINNSDNVTDMTANHTYNTLVLNQIPKSGSMFRVVMWERDKYQGVTPYFTINKRATFTGVYDTDGQKPTVDESGSIIWSNVDTSKREFILDFDFATSHVIFNKDYTKFVGVASISGLAQVEACEYLGDSTNTVGQLLYSKYFPVVDNGDLAIYRVSDASIYLLTKNTNYSIDFDTGEINMLTAYAENTKFYIKYRATIELEYEPENAGAITTAIPLDVNPFTSKIDRGLIYLTEELQYPASIALATDNSSVETGTDYARIIATIKDIGGNAVPDSVVTFYLEASDEYCYLDNNSISADKVTNELGVASVTFNQPSAVTANKTISIRAKVLNTISNTYIISEPIQLTVTNP